VLRLRRTAVAIASAACMAAAVTGVMAAPALAQSAHTTPSAQMSKISALTRSAQTPAFKQAYKTLKQEQKPATTIPCGDDAVPTGEDFWRCTGSSETAEFVGSSCAEGEYNAGSYYNVWAWVNNCPARVWLHQYTYPKDGTSGWSVCIAPDSLGYWSPPANPEPENIMVSANTASCETIYP
jgi:hypothetical protein